MLLAPAALERVLARARGPRAEHLELLAEEAVRELRDARRDLRRVLVLGAQDGEVRVADGAEDERLAQARAVAGVRVRVRALAGRPGARAGEDVFDEPQREDLPGVVEVGDRSLDRRQLESAVS